MPTTLIDDTPMSRDNSIGAQQADQAATYKIALIPGDGIGTEVLDAAWEVLDAAAIKFGFTLHG